MINPISSINFNNISKSVGKSCCMKADSDKVSFKGYPLRVIPSQNPANINALMYISINNLSNKTKNIFSKTLLWTMKKLAIFARPAQAVTDSNTKVLIAADERNLIKGGLILQNIPHIKSSKCQMLVVDKVNQGRKDQYKTLLEMGKALCKSCEENGISSVSWKISSKQKSAVNLFKKFAMPTEYKDAGITKFEASTERLKEFLDETVKKHRRIFA